jgi:S-DNA-T family DNA segregation ATPase FtsK/SpoIIIE
VDSRTILDRNGAEKLLGQGDMLYLPPGSSNIVRAKGCFVSDEEIRSVTTLLKTEAAPVFSEELTHCERAAEGEGDPVERDELYDEAVRVILETERGSASLLQRRLGIGYTRASRMIDLMAEDGIVGSYKGSKAREVLLTLEEWEARSGGNGGEFA